MTIQTILDEISRELKDVPGIVGVVLGGSRARGTHHENSDIDIGIYYDKTIDFDVKEVEKAAQKLDDEHRGNLVTSIGEWGPWIDGGGWLMVQGYHVDFIYRDINRVSEVMDDSLQGKVSSHYQTGHPHAFLNVMYMGEISVAKILMDPFKKLADLKAKTTPYPKPLKGAIIRYFLFEANFSLMFAKDNVEKDDIIYVAGHCFRSISCLNQVLFALNEEYCINEKKAVQMIESFSKKPEMYKERTDEIITLISSNPEYTRKAVTILQTIINETEILSKS